MKFVTEKKVLEYFDKNIMLGRYAEKSFRKKIRFNQILKLHNPSFTI